MRCTCGFDSVPFECGALHGTFTLSILCRDRAQEVAKAEIAELQRSKAREGLDVDYLKAVLLKGFESGELPCSSSMLPVIARLLHFSKEEMQTAQQQAKKAGKAVQKRKTGTVR